MTLPDRIRDDATKDELPGVRERYAKQEPVFTLQSEAVPPVSGL